MVHAKLADQSAYRRQPVKVLTRYHGICADPCASGLYVPDSLHGAVEPVGRMRLRIMQSCCVAVEGHDEKRHAPGDDLPRKHGVRKGDRIRLEVDFRVAEVANQPQSLEESGVDRRLAAVQVHSLIALIGIRLEKLGHLRVIDAICSVEGRRDDAERAFAVAQVCKVDAEAPHVILQCRYSAPRTALANATLDGRTWSDDSGPLAVRLGSGGGSCTSPQMCPRRETRLL